MGNSGVREFQNSGISEFMGDYARPGDIWQDMARFCNIWRDTSRSVKVRTSEEFREIRKDRGTLAKRADIWQDGEMRQDLSRSALTGNSEFRTLGIPGRFGENRKHLTSHNEISKHWVDTARSVEIRTSKQFRN